ncbi:MAG: succinyl-diaminopimelate desuccinylase [Pseudomonadota bacterium]
MDNPDVSPGSEPAPADPVAVAQSIIRCRSVTPEEGGALTYLADLLGGLGFTVERPVFRDTDTPPIENLFARIGDGAPHLAFAGHTDVVPPGDETAWRHPAFDAVIEDGVLYGRGAVDMKGAIAAFAAAAARYIAREGEPKGTLSLLITGDEEGPAINGTVKLMRWCAERGEEFDACVVGEPTNPERLGDAIKIGRRGSLSGTISVTGKQGHVAYPHLADNPVPRLVRLLAALGERQPDSGTEHFQPTNLEIVSVDVGNPAWNVIPNHASARFNARYNDTWSAETLKGWIAARLESAGDAGPFDIAYEPSISDVFLTRSDSLIATLSTAIEAQTGIAPALSTGGGTSDARFIKDYCPVVEFGLVGKTMHQVDECVTVADLTALSAIYETFLERYFK